MVVDSPPGRMRPSSPASCFRFADLDGLCAGLCESFSVGGVVALDGENADAGALLFFSQTRVLLS